MEAVLLKKYDHQKQKNDQIDLSIPDFAVEQMLKQRLCPVVQIEEESIKNELQLKLINEFKCINCKLVPYKPLECKKCFKIYCMSCQNLKKGEESQSTSISLSQNELAFEKKGPQKFNFSIKSQSVLKQRGPDQSSVRYFNMINSIDSKKCINCNEKGEFLQQVNPIVRNCINFNDFPHKCNKLQKKSEWMNFISIEKHVQMDQCSRYGCLVCNMLEFQGITGKQLFSHLKFSCSKVKLLCQVCCKEYIRSEFSNHICLRDIYIQKLTSKKDLLIDFLAEKLMMNKREELLLGPCQKLQCLQKWKNDPQQDFLKNWKDIQKQKSMIISRCLNEQIECVRCRTFTECQQKSYFCSQCDDNYCKSCLGYVKIFDLQELQLALK